MKHALFAFLACTALAFPSYAQTAASQPNRAPAAKKKKTAKKTVTLKIGTKKNELLFSKKELMAHAGAMVKLTFTNDADKTSGLQHNWVLVNPGKADDVATAGIAAGPDKGYVEESPDVLAHTKLLNPGESETLTFTAPSKPGDYQFICSFPGHATSMRGVFKVK